MSAVPEPNYLTHARTLLGLHEIHGSFNEPRILALAFAAHLTWVKNDEIPWCAILIGGVLEETGFRSTRSAAARSYSKWGIDVFESGPLFVPLGAICVLSREPNPAEGHVAFAVGYNRRGKILLLGGNQADMVSIRPFEPGRVIAARMPIEISQANKFDLSLLHRIPELDIDAPVSTNEA